MAKYIFVTGGVLSALGKGIAAASIGRLLESHGFKITIKKFDPYLNVDPGTMSPSSTGRSMSPMTGRKPTWIWGTTSVSPRPGPAKLTIGPPVRYTRLSSKKNVRAAI